MTEPEAPPPPPRWITLGFRGAALYGGIVLLASLSVTPPPNALLATYAFTGVACAFQIVFWYIGSDPRRHRPIIPAGVAEKLAFAVPALALATTPAPVVLASIDVLLGAGFAAAWWQLSRTTPNHLM